MNRKPTSLVWRCVAATGLLLLALGATWPSQQFVTAAARDKSSRASDLPATSSLPTTSAVPPSKSSENAAEPHVWTWPGQPFRDASGEPFGLRRSFVPADEPTRWPAGDWTPMRLDDLNRRLGQLVPHRPAPPAAQLLEADYSAIVVEGRVRGGRFRWNVERTVESAIPLVLSPNNLTLRNLVWTEREPRGNARGTPSDEQQIPKRDADGASSSRVISGTTPEGKFAVFLDRSQGEITGEWHVETRQFAAGLEVPCEFPPARATVVKWTLAEGHSLRSTWGDVAGPHPTDAAGFAHWSVDLGGASRALFSVVPQVAAALGTGTAPRVETGASNGPNSGAGSGSKAAPAPAKKASKKAIRGERVPLLVRSESAYSIRQDVVRIQADLTLETFEVPRQEFAFTTDSDVRVIAVTLGDVPLPFDSVVQGATRTLQVRIPDPVLGQTFPIRVQAITSAPLDRFWRVPVWQPVSGLLVERVVTVRVESPLQLADIDVQGYRQTDFTRLDESSETFTFRAWSDKSSLRMAFHKATFSAKAQVLTRIQAATDLWTATSQCEWVARSGDSFSLQLAIPEGWIVSDVRVDGPDAGDLLSWTVGKRAGRTELDLSFRDALSVDSRKRVRVTARRSAIPWNQAVAVPTFVPLRVAQVEALVAVTSETLAKPTLEKSGRFVLLEATESRLPGWSEDPWWQWPTRDDGHTLVLHSQRPDGGDDQFSLQWASESVDIEAEVRALLSGGRLREELALRCQPVSGPVQRVLVYVNETGPQWKWSLHDPAHVPGGAGAAGSGLDPRGRGANKTKGTPRTPAKTGDSAETPGSGATTSPASGPTGTPAATAKPKAASKAATKAGPGARDENTVALSAVLLSPAAHSTWHLPSTGELWELRLSAPVSHEFVLSAHRERTRHRVEPVSLVFAPQAPSFQGRVVLEFPEGELLQVRSQGLTRLSEDDGAARRRLSPIGHASGGTGSVSAFSPEGSRVVSPSTVAPVATDVPTSSDSASSTSVTSAPSEGVTKRKESRSNIVPIAWKYISSGAELTVNTPDASESLQGVSIHHMLVQSTVTLHGERDRYRVELDVRRLAGASHFDFELPEETILLDTWLDGHRVVASPEGRRWRILFPQVGEQHQIVLHYDRSHTGAFLLARRVLPLPNWEYAVGHCELQVRTSRRLLSIGRGDVAWTAPATVAWERRLFGPLGRAESGADWSRWFAAFRGRGATDADRSSTEPSASSTTRTGNAAALRASSPNTPSQASPHSGAEREAAAQDGATGGTEGVDGTLAERSLVGRLSSRPGFVAVDLYDASRMETLGWLTLLATVMLGLWAKTRDYFQGRFWPVCLIIWLWVTAAVVPEPWTPISGGGLCGMLLTVLYHRHWVRYSKWMSTEPKTVLAAPALGRAVIAGALMIACGLMGPLLADSASADDPPRRDTTSAWHEVLVPVRSGELETAPRLDGDRLVYVRPNLRAMLTAAVADASQTPYLIENSLWECTVGDDGRPVLRTLFDVHLLRPDAETRLRFPFGTANFDARQPCLVDGRPAKLSLTDDGVFVVVSVPTAANRHAASDDSPSDPSRPRDASADRPTPVPVPEIPAVNSEAPDNAAPPKSAVSAKSPLLRVPVPRPVRVEFRSLPSVQSQNGLHTVRLPRLPGLPLTVTLQVPAEFSHVAIDEMTVGDGVGNDVDDRDGDREEAGSVARFIPKPSNPNTGSNPSVPSTKGRQLAIRRPAPLVGGPAVLRLDWSTRAIAPESAPAPRVQWIGLIDAQPAVTLVRVQARYQVRPGERPLTSVEWAIPGSAWIRSVSGPQVSAWVTSSAKSPAVAPRTASDSTSATVARDTPTTADARRLTVSFQQPQSVAIVQLHLVLPTSSTDATRQFALPLPIDAEIVTGGETGLVALGYRAPSEFKLEPLEPNGEVLAVRPIDEAIRSLPGEWGRAQWSHVRAVTHPVTLRLSRAPSTWHVDQLAVGHFGMNGLELAEQATVTPNGSSVYRLRLTMDPRIDIQSLAVMQDGVDRLHRIAREGDHVTLLLDDRLSSPFVVQWRGVAAYQVGVPFAFPRWSYRDAAFAAGRIQLSRAADLAVPRSPWRAIADVGDTSAISGRNESAGAISLGTFELPPPPSSAPTGGGALRLPAERGDARVLVNHNSAQEGAVVGELTSLCAEPTAAEPVRVTQTPATSPTVPATVPAPMPPATTRPSPAATKREQPTAGSDAEGGSAPEGSAEWIVEIAAESFSIQLDRLTVLDPAGLEARWHHALRFRVIKGRSAQFEFVVPKEYGPQFDMHVEPAPEATRIVPGSKGRRVVLQYREPIDGEVQVAISAAWSPPAQGRWRPPEIDAAGAATSPLYLLLPHAGRFVPPSRGGGWTLADPPVSLLQVLGSRVSVRSDAQCYHRLGRAGWLEAATSSHRESSSSPLHARTALTFEPDGDVVGETRVWTSGVDREQLFIQWPVGATLEALLCDNQLLPVATPSGNQLVIPVSGRPFQDLAIHWRLRHVHGAGKRPLVLSGLRLPHPTELEPTAHSVAVQLEPHWQPLPLQGIAEANAIGPALDRWESALRLLQFESTRDLGHLVATATRDAQLERTRLAPLLADEASRFEQLQRETLAQLPSLIDIGSRPRAATERPPVAGPEWSREPATSCDSHLLGHWTGDDIRIGLRPVAERGRWVILIAIASAGTLLIAAAGAFQPVLRVISRHPVVNGLLLAMWWCGCLQFPALGGLIAATSLTFFILHFLRHWRARATVSEASAVV